MVTELKLLPAEIVWLLLKFQKRSHLLQHYLCAALKHVFDTPPIFEFLSLSVIQLDFHVAGLRSLCGHV